MKCRGCGGALPTAEAFPLDLDEDSIMPTVIFCSGCFSVRKAPRRMPAAADAAVVTPDTYTEPAYGAFRRLPDA